MLKNYLDINKLINHKNISTVLIINPYINFYLIKDDYKTLNNSINIIKDDYKILNNSINIIKDDYKILKYFIYSLIIFIVSKDLLLN